MSSSKSSSNQTSKSTTSNQDNRVANESGIVAGTGAEINIINPDQSDFIDKIIDFSAGVLDNAGNLVKDAVKTNETALNASVSQSNNALDRLQLGNASLIKDALPLVGVAILGFTAISLLRK